MRDVKPVPVSHHDKRKTFTFKDLASCSHVFLRIGRSRRSLEHPFSGPHKIGNRISDRVYEVDVEVNLKQISGENFKPAYVVRASTEVENRVIPASVPISPSIPRSEGPVTTVTSGPNVSAPEISPTTQSNELLNDDWSLADHSSRDLSQYMSSTLIPTSTSRSESTGDRITVDCLLDHDYVSRGPVLPKPKNVFLTF